jgi:hypothetical protein
MKSKPIFLFFLINFFVFCSPPAGKGPRIIQSTKRLFDTSFSALYVPLEKISLSAALDKDLASLKKTNPMYLFVKKLDTDRTSHLNDTFYLKMANTLVQHEISRYFKLVQRKADTGGGMDSVHLPTHWSRLDNDSGGSFENVSSFVKKTAAKYSVDLVIIPYECTLEESELQDKGWRNGKYGNYYKKPSTINAKALVHVQIWDKNGVLQFEQKGKGSIDRPLLYDAFKQNRPGNQSLVEFSKNMYSPALVRALGEACSNVFSGR